MTMSLLRHNNIVTIHVSRQLQKTGNDCVDVTCTMPEGTFMFV